MKTQKTETIKYFIRCSQHSTKFSNIGKRDLLDSFLFQYKYAVEQYIDYFWNNLVTYKTSVFSIKDDLLDIPAMLSTINIPINSNLTARALKCAITQALSITRSVTEKRRKRLYILVKLTEENKDTASILKQLEKCPLTKPVLTENFKAELNSICCSVISPETKLFDGFIELKSIGKEFGQIHIPIKEHRQSLKWKNKGTVKNSFLLSKDSVCIRYQIEKPKLKVVGKKVGVDQGITNTISLSDRQVSKTNKYGYDLTSILHKLERRKKDSKNFRQTQEERENYINWTINQLNLEDVKEIGLEEIVNIGYKKSKSRFSSHFTNTLIRDKIERRCEENGVHFKLQSSPYRSQRCSECGYVYSKNRNKKLFSCHNCRFSEDADINASLNHEQELIEIPHLEYLSNLSNTKGFYWKSNGLFDSLDKEITVPYTKTNSMD